MPSDADARHEGAHRHALLPAGDIGHGMTPFDALGREDLIRLLSAHHVALSAAKSAMAVAAVIEGQVGRSTFWQAEMGRRAKAMADHLVDHTNAEGRDEVVHRHAMRYVEGLAFPPFDPGEQPWRVCLGPCKGQWVKSLSGTGGCFNMRPGFDPATCPGTRPLTWDDLRAGSNGEGDDMGSKAERMDDAVGSLRKLVDASPGQGVGLAEFLAHLDHVAFASSVDRGDLQRAFNAAHGQDYRVTLAAPGETA